MTNDYIFYPLYLVQKKTKIVFIAKFLNLMKKTKKKIICLGGINEKNLKQIKNINPYGIASISLFQNKGFAV